MRRTFRAAQFVHQGGCSSKFGGDPRHGGTADAPPRVVGCIKRIFYPCDHPGLICQTVSLPKTRDLDMGPHE